MGIPHFAYPLTLGQDGSFATLEQDSRAEIRQCVAVLLATTIGSRIELPSYGVPDVTFTHGETIGLVQQAIATWEPRAAAATVDMQVNNDGTAQIRAQLPAVSR